MITFYRTTEDAGAQEIQEALHELCLAHEVVLVPASGAGRRGLPEGTRPPVLIDEGAVYQDRMRHPCSSGGTEGPPGALVQVWE